MKINTSMNRKRRPRQLKRRARSMVAMLGFAATITIMVTAVPASSSIPAAKEGDATTLADGDVTPQHAIWCSGGASRPYRNGTAVVASGYVSCNGEVDVANTCAQLQVFENAAYRLYGNPVCTSSTAAYFEISDSAGLKVGSDYYRLRIHREAFHGTWGTNDWYGNSIYITRY